MYNMKFYISGPITGYPDDNKPAFDRTAEILRASDFAVLNPHDLDLIDKVETWEDNLKRDIRYLVDCDAVLLLPGWDKSKGARLEVSIAYHLGMKFYRLNPANDLISAPITIDQEITELVANPMWDGSRATF
jgi:hypothetical protein